MNSETGQDREIIHSWKGIATYFDASVRSVQRWERERGLKIHRDSRGHPFIYASDYPEGRIEERVDTPWFRRLIGIVTLLAVIGTVTYIVIQGASAGIPGAVVLEGEVFQVLDTEGRLQWARRYPNMTAPSDWGWEVSFPDSYLIADLNDDGLLEVLLNVIPSKEGDDPGRLECFDEEGRFLWSFTFGRTVHWGSREINSRYAGHTVRLIETPDRKLLLVTATHTLWFPTQVALLEPSTGDLVSEYWHPGALSHSLLVDLDGEGADEVVLAGINNPGEGPGFPALLALRIPFKNPDPQSDPVVSFGGGEIFYVLLPRPDVTTKLGAVLLIDGLELEGRDRILVRTRLSSRNVTKKQGNLFYLFDFTARVTEFHYSPWTIPLHDELWERGLLDHQFSAEEALSWRKPSSLNDSANGTGLAPSFQEP